MAYKAQWRRLVLWGDALVAAAFLGIAAVTVGMLGLFEGFKWVGPSSWEGSTGKLVLMLALISIVIGLFAYLHFRIRNFAAARILKKIKKHYTTGLEGERIREAFIHNTRPWHSIFRKSPVGWNGRVRKRLHQVIAEANEYVQTLNDKFTDPSGDLTSEEKETPPLAMVASVSDAEENQVVEEPVRSQ